MRYTDFESAYLLPCAYLNNILNRTCPTNVPLHDSTNTVLYHPVYGKEEVSKVKVVHFENKTLGDKFAAGLVKLFRKGFDIVTGYKHVDIQEAIAKAEKEGSGKMTLKEMREKGLVMTPEQWLAVSFFLTTMISQKLLAYTQSADIWILPCVSLKISYFCSNSAACSWKA